MTREIDLRAHLPLTEATLFILVSLASKSRHGYAIMKEVRVLTDNRVRLSTGTLYDSLKRLLVKGWIQRVANPATEDGGRARKSYALTDLGRRVLSAEASRLQELVAVTHRYLEGWPA